MSLAYRVIDSKVHRVTPFKAERASFESDRAAVHDMPWSFLNVHACFDELSDDLRLSFLFFEWIHGLGDDYCSSCAYVFGFWCRMTVHFRAECAEHLKSAVEHDVGGIVFDEDFL